MEGKQREEPDVPRHRGCRHAARRWYAEPGHVRKEKVRERNEEQRGAKPRKETRDGRRRSRMSRHGLVL